MSNIRDQTYVLLIENRKDKDIRIGKLGQLNFGAGYYIYVGSAKKNLRTRIKRHLVRNKKKFWHIDYLLSSGDVGIREIRASSESQECRMAQRLYQKRYGYIRRFGSSDCHCPAHLFFTRKDIGRVKKSLKKAGFRNEHEDCFR